MENNYVDYLMANYPLETDSEYSTRSESYIQTGGADENKPTGGFPSIYLCTKEELDENKTEITDTKKREISAPKSAISIRDILSKRKKVVPFV